VTDAQAARQDGVRFLVGVSWLGAAVASVCFCINLLFVEDRGALWVGNALDPVQRRLFVVSMIASTLMPALVAAVTIRRRSLPAVAEDVWLWSHRLSPLVLLAPIAPLIDRASFIDRPITALSYMFVVGLMAAAIGTRCLERGFAKEPAPIAGRARALVPSALTGAVCMSLFAHFAFYALMRHHQMRSDAYDLGIFDNMMWHLTHGEWFGSTPAFGPEGNHLHRHATFGAPLFVPLYAIWPRSETLIVLQAAFAASTPVPIYLLGRRLLGSAWLGFVFALCYALYAPTHGAVFYDFHFLTMAAPLFAWVFYLLFTEHTRALIIMTALTLGWREDTGAVLAFAGILVWLVGVYPRRTLIFVIVCVAYFTLVKFVFMPLGGSHASYAFYYSRLQAPGAPGFWAVIETCLTNPFYVFDEVFGRKRLLYVLHLFVPLLFFPLRDRTTWIALVPAAVFTLMASRDPLFEIYFQYTVYWAPTAFLCMFIVLQRRFVETGRRQALTANASAILLTTLLTSFFYGSVFESPKMRGGFEEISYEWTEKDAERLAAFRELAAQIPPDASVALTSREVPHVSNRRNAYSLHAGYFDADFLLVHRKYVSKKKAASKQYRKALDTGQYEQVAKKDDFFLWRRIDGAEAKE
jgi:uncharacterized membrane protein